MPSGSFFIAGNQDYVGLDVPDWDASVAHCLDQFPPCGGASNWSVEFRIARNTVGGWQRSIGLALAQYDVATLGDVYAWPQTTVGSDPETWVSVPLN
jgi:hypothetical protein